MSFTGFAIATSVDGRVDVTLHRKKKLHIRIPRSALKITPELRAKNDRKADKREVLSSHLRTSLTSQ